MTIQRIVKMEFFKFFHEKAYLWTFGVMAIINIVWTVLSLNIANLGDSDEAGGMLMMTFGIIVLVDFILLYWYPFHVLSVDYNNNVMALLMASGISRKRLFFAKLIAVIGLTILASLVLLLIPAILFLVKMSQLYDAGSSWESIALMFRYLNHGHPALFSLNLFLSYLTSVTLMILSCTWMKGAKRAILVFIGLTWAYNITSGLFVGIGTGVNMDWVGLYGIQYVIEIFAMILFGYLTQKIMEKQNL